jgi:hypothetical protein
VTLRAREGIGSLRGEIFWEVQRALARANKETFRVVHFSVQTDHVHLIVEAEGRERLIRGVQGLAVRCARAVNRAAGRKGKVWSHRNHRRALRSPREVRAGMVYVLLNFRKHLRAAPAVDPRSSGPWFEGWVQRPPVPDDECPVERARTWLALVGWHRAGGRIAVQEAPARL